MCSAQVIENTNNNARNTLQIKSIKLQNWVKKRLMIFPTDYRERVLKEQKSRHYKAMLDQQIRQNSLFNQQSKLQRRSTRIKTQPTESYHQKSRINSSSRQLPHESTFLPSINNNSSSIIDHTYKYLPTPDYPAKKYFSNLTAKKHSLQKYNDEELDDHLDRCLEECDQLIHGISKNFINLNSQLRGNSLKRKNFEGKNQRTRHHSDFDLFKNEDSRMGRGYDNLPVTNLKSSQLFGLSSDIGRNQMMNYNMLKSKEKQILHISTPRDSRDQGGFSPANRDSYDNNNKKSGSKTKRKTINDMLFQKVKTTPNNRKDTKDPLNFDTINSDQQNEFVDIAFPEPLPNQIKQSMQRMKKQAQKMAEEIKIHEDQKKKDSKIIQHLRKAKNRGNILFKKIEVFRKQREELEQTSKNNSNSTKSLRNQPPTNLTNDQSTGSKKNLSQLGPEMENHSDKQKNELKKQSIPSSISIKQEPMKEEQKKAKTIPKQSRSNSKASQKRP